MPHLIFCATSEGMTRRIAERQVADGTDPFVLRKGSDTPLAIEALRSGRNVVANAFAGAFGWHVPDGVSVALDEDMWAPGLQALRTQCEGRVHRVRSEATRVEMLIPGEDTDQRIAQALRTKAADPFSAEIDPSMVPEAS
jgi:hypothetical protein